MRHHEHSGQFQLPWLFESNHVSTTAVTTLVIMVIDKREGRKWAHHTPAGAECLKVSQLANVVADIGAVFELSNSTETCMFKLIYQ